MRVEAKKYFLLIVVAVIGILWTVWYFGPVFCLEGYYELNDPRVADWTSLKTREFKNGVIITDGQPTQTYRIVYHNMGIPGTYALTEQPIWPDCIKISWNEIEYPVFKYGMIKYKKVDKPASIPPKPEE